MIVKNDKISQDEMIVFAKKILETLHREEEENESSNLC